MKKLIFFFSLSFLIYQYSSGVDNSFTQEDRERLIRLEVALKEFKDSVDKRFEQIEKRFAEFRDYVDKRFEQMISFLWILSAIFVGIVGVTIGFAIWDRKTMVRPFESKATKRNFINFLKLSGILPR